MDCTSLELGNDFNYNTISHGVLNLSSGVIAEFFTNNIVEQDSDFNLSNCNVGTSVINNTLTGDSDFNSGNANLTFTDCGLSYNVLSGRSSIEFNGDSEFDQDIDYNVIGIESEIILTDTVGFDKNDITNSEVNVNDAELSETVVRDSTLTVSNGTVVDDSSITGMIADINTGLNYDRRTYMRNAYSNFEMTLDFDDVFSAGTLTLPAGAEDFVGIFRTDNIPASCTVSSIVNDAFLTPYVIYGDTSGTITWGFTPLPLSYTQITAKTQSYACFDYLTNLILAWLNY